MKSSFSTEKAKLNINKILNQAKEREYTLSNKSMEMQASIGKVKTTQLVKEIKLQKKQKISKREGISSHHDSFEHNVKNMHKKEKYTNYRQFLIKQVFLPQRSRRT